MHFVLNPLVGCEVNSSPPPARMRPHVGLGFFCLLLLLRLVLPLRMVASPVRLNKWSLFPYRIFGSSFP